MRGQPTQPTNVPAARGGNATAASRENAADAQDGHRGLAAVLRRDPSQSASLVAKLKAAGIDAVALGSVDALHGFLSGNQLTLLILDNEIDGFFTGLDVIRKVRASLIRVPAILLQQMKDSPPIDGAAVGAVTVVDARVSDDEIAKAAIQIGASKTTRDESGIPQKARDIIAGQADLPVLSQLALHLLRYLEMPTEQVPVAELCRMVSLDPRATAVLLKAANASMNGLSREIGNVADAVRVLGVRPTIGHVLNAAVTNGIGALSKFMPSTLQVWYARRGMLIACTTSSFGSELEGRSDETTFLMGVLQDVGILGLFRAFPRQYQSLLKRWQTIGQLKLPALEQAEFDCTHADVSAAMMERWGMPASFIPPVLQHLKPAAKASQLGIDAGLHRVMTIAEALADMIELSHPSRRFQFNKILADYGVEQNALCHRSLRRAADKAAEAYQLLSLPLPNAEQLEGMVRSTITGSLLDVEDASAAEPAKA